MLRDVLRRHPNLDAPEETHFYRWAEPFGTPGYIRYLSGNQVLKKHRAMDGISEEAFAQMLATCTSRADLYRVYMKAFLAKRKPGATRWFDKTPQNVYGAAMIAADMPGTKFVHIIRDPRDVVSSLRIGKVLKVESLIGACNYWTESVSIVQSLKRAYPARVWEVRYEEFTADPLSHLRKLAEFLDEPFEDKWFQGLKIAPRGHQDESVLSPAELMEVSKICGRWAAPYGYNLGGELSPEAKRD